MVCLTAKDAWRTLRNEQVTNVGYTAFMKWVHKLNIELSSGIGADVLAVLRNYAEVRAKAPNTRTHENGQAKLQALRAIAKRQTWKGSELVDLIELNGAISRATLYRRVVDGEKFNATTTYTREQARLLIFGV